MNFEDLQKVWQSHDAGAGLKLNPSSLEELLNDARTKQQQFRRTIFWRDVREVSVAAILIPIFIYMGFKTHWTLHLGAFACFVVGAYFLIDRFRQRKMTPDLHDSLKECATTSLAEVDHQIWLLKNVAWWYLLPLFVPMAVFLAWSSWRGSAPVIGKLLGLLIMVGLVGIIFYAINRLNQYAVKRELEPRRQELEKLLGTLENGNPPTRITRGRPLGPLLLVVAACAIAIFAHSTRKPKGGGTIDEIRRNRNLPALAVIVVKDGEIRERAASGFRKSGDPTPVTTNDLWHIGSCTKPMTATLAAVLIEEGVLDWDTTIGEVFPELGGRMNKQYEGVTVEQLLQHRSGIPGPQPPAAWKRAWEEQGTPMEQRREFIEAVLAQPPAATPGTKMIYSNQGYAVLGAMLEKVTGRDYETLMRQRLFEPLGMDTAGFGSPGTPGKVDQPWGHRQGLSPIPLRSDNPPAIAPAARVHCSLDDLARFAILHLGHSTNGLLKPETLLRLRTPPMAADINTPLENHGGAWFVLQRGWAGGTTLWHNGSNTLWYIVMWLAPDKNFAVIAATNIAGSEAAAGCNDAATAMIEKWLGEKPNGK